MSIVQMKVAIDNVYEDGDEVHVEKILEVSPPPTDNGWTTYIAKLDDWADDQIFPETGTGQEEGDAGYFVEVLECEDRPDLVGIKFEWGT